MCSKDLKTDVFRSVKVWIFVRLILFPHNCIVTWIILFIGTTRTVHTCRKAALHAILSFLVSLFASYDPQSHKKVAKKWGPCPPGPPSPPRDCHPCSKPFYQRWSRKRFWCRSLYWWLQGCSKNFKKVFFWSFLTFWRHS